MLPIYSTYWNRPSDSVSLTESPGRSHLSDQERRLFALSPRNGGLGVPDTTTTASQSYRTSVNITAALIQIIESDQPGYDENTMDAQQQAMRQAHTENRQALRTEEMALKEEKTPENLK